MHLSRAQSSFAANSIRLPDKAIAVRGSCSFTLRKGVHCLQSDGSAAAPPDEFTRQFLYRVHVLKIGHETETHRTGCGENMAYESQARLSDFNVFRSAAALHYSAHD